MRKSQPEEMHLGVIFAIPIIMENLLCFNVIDARHLGIGTEISRNLEASREHVLNVEVRTT